MASPSDFRDIDKDGVDDNEGERIQKGYDNYRDAFFQPVDRDYDRMTGLQTGIIANQVGKDMDMDRSEQQAEFQSGLYKDNAKFGADLDLRNQREGRADEFGYGMRSLDKQFELTDAFQNNEFGRNIGTMQATGEQTRKNFRAQGVEDRLSRITQGEQDRLGTAAVGDQTRKNYEFEDNINARGEARDKSRARGLARSF